PGHHDQPQAWSAGAGINDSRSILGRFDGANEYHEARQGMHDGLGAADQLPFFKTRQNQILRTGQRSRGDHRLVGCKTGQSRGGDHRPSPVAKPFRQRQAVYSARNRCRIERKRLEDAAGYSLAAGAYRSSSRTYEARIEETRSRLKFPTKEVLAVS